MHPARIVGRISKAHPAIKTQNSQQQVTKPTMALNREREALLELAHENDGLVTADMVVEAAADPDSPLHRHFQWDDTAAADAFRRWQARVLLAKCRITVQDRAATNIRAFVSLPSDRKTGGGYRMTVDVLSDKDQAEELRLDMQRRVDYWLRESRGISKPVRKLLLKLNHELQTQPARQESQA